ncbi:PD40 domain-containing protein [Photobacterium kishitanii]|uniref:Translocation protein TolB n=1 Tax=Photobacterium kishitanii TaxID=318456 RepID=A0A2T3KMT1_9GAMM|nr:PD40 domain-containing protein [Photobacterium kishitanii]PSV01055.1 hypothetical protein C9J27_03290 [Photobacterium kishitanii]
MRFKLYTIVACLITCAAHATPIKIETKLTENSGVPVVFQQNRIISEKIINNLNRTSKIRSIFGNCQSTQKKIKQSVACVSIGSGSINISVPNGLGSRRSKSIPFEGDLPLMYSDEIFKEVLNTSSSPFLTKIAYVSKSPKTGKYKLAIANYDGTGAQVLLTSPEPILSPAWSPNGNYLTYVSYEKVRASIFIQDIHSNRRVSILDLKGLNAYPSFYNDHELLVSLSSESNYSRIYKYNILSKKLTQLSGDKSVDIFPRKLRGKEGIVKVSLNTNDIPYIFIKMAGSPTKPLATYPLNTPSVSETNTILATSNNKLLEFKYDRDGKWKEPKVIAKDVGIESPSISANGLAIFYINEKKGRFFINSTLNDGENFSTIKSSSEDLIQIVAH